MTRAWASACLLLAVVGVAHAQRSSHGAALEDVRVESGPEGVVVHVVTAGRAGSPRVQWLDAPPRLLVDLAETEVVWRAGPPAEPGSFVKNVRAATARPGVARLVIETARKVPFRIEPGPAGFTILLTVHEGTADAPAREAGRSAPRAPAGAASPAAEPTERDAPRLYGVVHGKRGWVAFIEDPRSRRVSAYQTGQSIGDAVVERIDAGTVTLKGPTGAVQLRLRGEPAGRAEARPR